MSKVIKTVLLAGLAAGTADGLAAGMILGKMNFVRVFQFVASGAFGSEAFEGGTVMALYGVLFHYFIATSWATLYIIVFPYLSFPKKEKIASGLLYGIFVWCMMNLVVLPMTNINRGGFTWSGVAINMSILMVCIGLPISLITAKLYPTNKQAA